MTTTDKEIGVATLNYSVDGEFETAQFSPTMKVDVSSELMQELIDSVDCKNEDEVVKNQAFGVFASWFQKMNEIELADRAQYEVAAELVAPCERWENGQVKQCQIRFIFKHL